MSFTKKLLVFSSSFLLTACASMINGKYQPVTVVPVGGDFETTECVMKNTHGEWERSVERETIVRRDYEPLEVRCKSSDSEGVATIESKTQWRYYWANFFIWDLCLISCVVDIATGAFYDYPAVIHVPMKPVPGMAKAAPAEAGRQPVPSVATEREPSTPAVVQPAERQTIAPTPVRRTASSSSASADTVAYARTGEAEWRNRAELMAASRDCVDVKIETLGDAGAMYSMLCRTGQELLMCSDVGCRVMD